MSRMVVEDSKQQIKAVQHVSSDPESVVSPLESMCMSLVMGVEVYLRGFDSMRAVPVLVHMAENERFFKHGDTMAMIFRALALIMEHVPTSYCGAHPYHKRLVRVATEALSRVHCREVFFNNLDRVMLMEEALRLIRFITVDECNISLVYFGLKEVTKTTVHDNALLTRQVLDVLLVVCSKVILPSEAKKRRLLSSLTSFFSCCALPVDDERSEKPCVKPAVVTTEHVLVPFLQGMIQQFVANIETSPDSWSLLELSLQCLGMLIRRAVLFKRLSSARKMITPELQRSLYQLLVLNDGNVALDPSVRSERLLFSETMIDIILTADWVNASDMLLFKEARTFYGIILDDSDPGIATLLDDPFPVGGVSRAAHRRDKNHIVSIAAVRHFVLASPPLPSEAFGPRPKVVLPVHKWMWEDEMRHHSPIPEEACATLETCLARRTKEVTLRIRSKVLTANLATMKICSGFGGAELNIARKFVPFVFHVMNEVDIRSVKATRDATGGAAYLANTADENIGVPLASSAEKAAKKCEYDLDRYYAINSGATVPSVSMKLAELYLEDLCKYATWVSGSMAMQLGVCACASLLQGAILAKRSQQLTELLRKVMRPLCDMFRVALISADKSTKSVALTMMVWLLRHPGSAEWRAAEMIMRCGVQYQLQILASTKCRRTDDGLGAHAGGKSNRLATKIKLDGHENRTMHLTTMARAILMSIEKDSSENSVTLTERPYRNFVISLWDAVGELKANITVCGTHKKVVAQVLKVMEKTSGNVTAFEISMMGIADTVLGYLLMLDVSGSEDRAHKGRENTSFAVTPKVAGGNRSTPVGLALDTDVDLVAFGGVRVADQLKRRCQKERLDCFLQLAVEYPRGVEALIENLVSTLSLNNNLPLVESLVTTQRVVCTSLSRAMSTTSQLSQSVSLCRKAIGLFASSTSCARGVNHERGESPSQHNVKSQDPVLSSPAQNSGSHDKTVLTSHNSCSSGHRLHSARPVATKRSCEWCGEDVGDGFSCAECGFFLCVSCSKQAATPCDDNSAATLASGFKPATTGTPTPADLQRSRESVPIGAHLFSSIGDIERTFRTGSNSTKGTEVAPCPPSTLSAELFMERVQLVLSRKKETVSFCEARLEVQRLLDGFIAQRETVESLDELEDQSGRPSAHVGERCRLERLLQDAMEERYVLYTTPTGRCAYQETLMGNIMQRALSLGQVELVAQLESCLMTLENHGEGLNLTGIDTDLSKTHLTLRKDVVSGKPRLLSVDNGDRVASGPNNRFHHFESDKHKYCCCGQHSREEMNTSYPSKLVRKPSELSQSLDVLLLLLLHKVLHPLIEKNTIPIDSNVFVSTILTTQLVKSVAASALRVAVLPPRIAVTGWVDFILTEAKFLLPSTVRESVVRFLAYGARRELHAHVRSSMGSRRYRACKVYPSEWSKCENHKFMVDRDDLLHDAYIALRKGAECRTPISIQFKGEVGMGQGPTAHFYTLVARELTKARLRLWSNPSRSPTCRGSADSCGESRLGLRSASGALGDDEFVGSKVEGLFPIRTLQPPQRTATNLQPPCSDGAKVVTERFGCMDDFVEMDAERAQLFYLIGVVLGRAFTDTVVFPLDLCPAVALFLCRGVPPARVVLRCKEEADATWEPERPIDFMSLGIEEVELMDQQVAASLRSLLSLDSKELSSLELPFTMPGDDRFEMIDKGLSMRVDPTNISGYIKRAASALLYESVVMPIRFMTCGFRDVVPCEALAALDAKEAIALLCGNRDRDSEPLWTAAEIKSIIVPDHGYTSESPQIVMLQNILAKRFCPREQRAFLLFCTGCPRLPHGGISALGAITVVQSTHMPTPPDAPPAEGNSRDGPSGRRRSSGRSRRVCRGAIAPKAVGVDWPLPSVNTCFRYLKMPPYPTEELMYNKLQLSIMYAGDTFELS